MKPFRFTLGQVLGGLFSVYLLAVFVIHWITDLCPSSDEYTYAQGSRLVTEGFFPVRDFWSHNVDGLLYFFGYWMKLFGFTLFAGRGLSVLLMLLACIALVYQIVKIYRIPLWLTLFALACMNAWFNIGTLVEHHGISDSFSLTSFVIFLEWFRKSESRVASLSTDLYFYACLLTAGIAASARIHYILFPIFYLLFAVLSGRKIGLKQAAFGCILLVVTNWMSFGQIGAVGLNDFLYMKFFHRKEFAYWMVGEPFTMESFGWTLITTFVSLGLGGFWLHLVYVSPRLVKGWKVSDLPVQSAQFATILLFVMLGAVVSSGYYGTMTYFAGHTPLLLYPFALCYGQLTTKRLKSISIALLCVSFFSAFLPDRLREGKMNFWESNFKVNHQIRVVLDSVLGRKPAPNAAFDAYYTTEAGHLMTSKALDYLQSIGKAPAQAVIYDPFGPVQFMSGMKPLSGFEMSHEYGYHIVRFPLKVDKNYLKKLHMRPLEEISDDLKRELPDVVVWDGLSLQAYTDLIMAHYRPYFVNAQGYGLYVRKSLPNPKPV